MDTGFAVHLPLLRRLDCEETLNSMFQKLSKKMTLCSETERECL